MNTARAWLMVALSNFRAADCLLGQNDPAGYARPAISRAYYAGYAAAHALACHAGRVAPETGTWKHSVLPGELEVAVKAIEFTPTDRARNAVVFKKQLVDLRNLRVAADYHPQRSVEVHDARVALKYARSIVELAKGYLA